MIFLLDVNVLIALVDPAHVSHEAAHDWFRREGGQHWATCPLTENGVIRIVGHRQYPNSPGSPAAAADIVARLRCHAGHVFWPDDVSLLDPQRVNTDRLLTPGQITDSYLLALAIAHAGQLASLDRRMAVSAVIGGAAGLCLI